MGGGYGPGKAENEPPYIWQEAPGFTGRLFCHERGRQFLRAVRLAGSETWMAINSHMAAVHPGITQQDSVIGA